MKIRILFSLLVFAWAGNSAAQDVPERLADDQCVTCHADFGALPDGMLLDGPHMRPGLSCAGCHGGDASTDDEDVAHAGNFQGVPAAVDIPGLCGSCHSDLSYMRQFNPSASTGQVADYYTSLHGQELRLGNEDVAQCESCHTAHAILPASDARSTTHPLNVPQMCDTCHGDADLMRPYGLRTHQYADYAGSVHGVALLDRQDTGAPACNDCHGNHGAAPPGVTSIEHVCGMCHVNNEVYFSQTGMADAFAEGDLHACEECHGIHDVPPATDEMIGIGDESVCIACHGDGDVGWEIAAEMGQQITMLKAAQDSAHVLLERVERAGMNDIDIAFLLQESHQSLIQTRTLVHTFDPMETEAMVETGLETAHEAAALGLAELDQYRFRRMGFGIATLMITLLTVALFLKIRDMERA